MDYPPSNAVAGCVTTEVPTQCVSGKVVTCRGMYQAICSSHQVKMQSHLLHSFCSTSISVGACSDLHESKSMTVTLPGTSFPEEYLQLDNTPPCGMAVGWNCSQVGVYRTSDPPSYGTVVRRGHLF